MFLTYFIPTGLAFIATFVLYIPFISFARRFLRKRIDKKLRPKTAKLHKHKVGTPQLGGLLLLFTTTCFALLLYPTQQTFTILGIVWLFGVFGIWDDLLSSFGGNNLGLPLWSKVGIQTLISIVASNALVFGSGRAWGSLLPNLGFSANTWTNGIIIWLVVAVVFYFATVTAVNVTDGLDGLAASLLALCFSFYALVFLWQEETILAGITLIALGATLAFLCFNEYPATIFMGDTGAVGLGALLTTLALLSPRPLLLLLVGFPFFAEVASVALQRTSKALRGKRIFLLSPLHHHFEKLGYSEHAIVWGFRIVGFICFILSITFILFSQI